MKIKEIVIYTGVFLVIVTLFGFFQLGWMKFFEPRKENIRREVFEETQSYVHGKIQELSKLKQEYDNSPEKQAGVKEVVKIRFAEFDESKIKAKGLRDFLVQIRGY